MKIRGLRALENAEHDRADKGKGDIGGDYAQSAGEKTKGHRETSGVYVAARFNAQDNRAFPAKKVSPAVHPRSHDHARVPQRG